MVAGHLAGACNILDPVSWTAFQPASVVAAAACCSQQQLLLLLLLGITCCSLEH
jgi:hypothetical protein